MAQVTITCPNCKERLTVDYRTAMGHGATEGGKIMSIIQRLRDQLPLGASIFEDEDFIIFWAPGHRPVIYNASGVTTRQLEETASRIIETAKAVSFGKGV